MKKTTFIPAIFVLGTTILCQLLFWLFARSATTSYWIATIFSLLAIGFIVTIAVLDGEHKSLGVNVICLAETAMMYILCYILTGAGATNRVSAIVMAALGSVFILLPAAVSLSISGSNSEPTVTTEF